MDSAGDMMGRELVDDPADAMAALKPDRRWNALQDAGIGKGQGSSLNHWIRARGDEKRLVIGVMMQARNRCAEVSDDERSRLKR